MSQSRSEPAEESAVEPLSSKSGRRRADTPAASDAQQQEAPRTKSAGPESEPVESAEETANETSKEDKKKTKREKKPSGPLSWLKEIAIVIVIALVLSFLLKTFLFRAFVIPSGSMQNTLQIDDRIFINELVPRPFALQRGDVVVFKDTQGWLAADQTVTAAKATTWFQDVLVFIGLMPDESQQHLVKRVIGMAGDHVICCDAQNRITVNGQSLDEPYLFPGSDNAAGPNATFDVVVPAGKIWVMGDNRNHSADSRFHQDLPGQGFIDFNDVEGTATVIAWPLNRWSFIGNYPDTFRNVPAPSSAPVSSPTPTHSGK